MWVVYLLYIEHGGTVAYTDVGPMLTHRTWLLYKSTSQTVRSQKQNIISAAKFKHWRKKGKWILAKAAR